jgi:hypothetical protein
VIGLIVVDPRWKNDREAKVRPTVRETRAHISGSIGTGVPQEQPSPMRESPDTGRTPARRCSRLSGAAEQKSRAALYLCIRAGRKRCVSDEARTDMERCGEITPSRHTPLLGSWRSGMARRVKVMSLVQSTCAGLRVRRAAVSGSDEARTRDAQRDRRIGIQGDWRRWTRNRPIHAGLSASRDPTRCGRPP